MLLQWFKEAQLALLTMSTTVVIAACYGAQYAAERALRLVDGKVTHAATPVAGIQICARTQSSGVGQSACDSTDSNGRYEITAEGSFEEDAWYDGFELEVRDVDGPTNGSYADQLIEVAPENVPTTIDIELKPAP